MEASALAARALASAVAVGLHFRLLQLAGVLAVRPAAVLSAYVAGAGDARAGRALLLSAPRAFEEHLGVLVGLAVLAVPLLLGLLILQHERRLVVSREDLASQLSHDALVDGA